MLAGGSRAHREGPDRLIVLIHGGGLRGTVHHDAILRLLLHGVECVHVAFNGNRRALATLQGVHHLRGKGGHVLDLQPIHTFDYGHQHRAVAVDCVFL